MPHGPRRRSLPRGAGYDSFPTPVRPDLRAITASFAAVPILFATAAGAQDRQYQVQIQAGLQVTDNVLFTPMNGPAQATCEDNNPNNDGQNCARPGFLANLNPNAVFTYETPRWLHALAYNFALQWNLGGQDQINFEHGIEGRSRYDVSELTQTVHALRVQYGQQTFFPQAAPGIAGNAAAFQPQAQEFQYVNLEVQQGVTRALGEDTGLNGNLTFQTFQPIQDLTINRDAQQQPPRPGIYNANIQLGLQHNDAPTEYGVALGSQLIAFDVYCRVAAECGDAEIFACVENRCVIKEGQLTPTREEEIRAITTSPQLLSRLVGSVRRDWQNGFATDLDLGVMHVMRVVDFGGQNWQPIGRAAIRYDREEANLELTYNHGAQINPAVVGVVVADNVELTGNVPIDRETRDLLFQIQLGYQHGSIVDEFGDLSPTFDLIATDVALEYRPRRWLPSATIALRYQFRYQITQMLVGGGFGGAAAANAALESGPLQAMRNAVLLNFGYQFPDRGQQQ